ncbi:hypothetical protein NIES39_L05110 [Arthrospira platensis NIES-39]|nr:hypothetical protein NIES39_L05110 [Arthrospira platensis NIES-39]
MVTSHILRDLRLHLSLLISRPDNQSLRGFKTFRLYGHSIFRFVLSTGVLLKVCVGIDEIILLFPLLF